ncbi:MAG TPA: enoyl-CoA hydratase/isomerase family protein, partial [Candidatus Methylomirabilis sp.]|nr:enoyl-CoA hydratase/isomerase family protein [Candidatus Methylomirabilis sp.]
MNGKELIYAVKGHVATITMNRPDRYNALSLRMIEEFLEVISACEENPEIRAVILTGAGTAFCAGGDVKEFVDRLEAISQHLRRLLTSFHGAISRMNRMSKPVIAAVNGVAAGAGMSLAMACDLAVAAESARFIMAYSKIGATPDGSSTYFLPRLVGLRRALELTYTNRALTAREAEAWGLVNRVVPDAEL